MVNGVDIAVGGVSGAAFGSIFDGIREVLVNAAEFTTSRTDIKSTLETLQPLIQEMEGKNNTLLVQDELKDLKEEIGEGLKRVQELSEESVWNYCMRPFYNVELDGMDKSLKRLLQILQVQEARDVKEVLVQVNDCRTDVTKISIQLDGISAWGGKTTDQLDQVASKGKETLVQVNKVSSQLDGCKTDVNKISNQLDDCKTDVNKISNQLDDCKTEIIEGISKRVLDQRIISPSFVPISEPVASLVEMEALGSSLLTMGQSVDEALSKPHNPFYEKLDRLKVFQEWLMESLRPYQPPYQLDEDYLFQGTYGESSKLFMTFDYVNALRIKVEEGTKLIRKCSNVDVWTDHKSVKYASKLDDLAKLLEASVQRLKSTNSTMPKGFATQNSRMLFCSPPFSVPCIKSSIECC